MARRKRIKSFTIYSCCFLCASEILFSLFAISCVSSRNDEKNRKNPKFNREKKNGMLECYRVVEAATMCTFRCVLSDGETVYELPNEWFNHKKKNCENVRIRRVCDLCERANDASNFQVLFFVRENWTTCIRLCFSPVFDSIVQVYMCFSYSAFLVAAPNLMIDE